MPTKLVTAVASPGIRAVEENLKRMSVKFFLPYGQDAIQITDKPGGYPIYTAQPGEIVIFSKAESDDVKKPYYLILPATSTNGQCYVSEDIEG